MYFLTYVSTAIKNIKTQDVQDILNKARIKNSENDITGLLLGRSKTFFQLLEGKKESVLRTFQKIAKDPRHKQIEILFETEIEGGTRIFPTWQMGFIGERLSAPELEGLVQSLHTIVTSKKPDKEKIIELLRKFSKTLPTSAREILALAHLVKE